MARIWWRRPSFAIGGLADHVHVAFGVEDRPEGAPIPRSRSFDTSRSSIDYAVTADELQTPLAAASRA